MLSSLKPIVIADVIIFDKEILGLYLPDDNSIIIKNNIINSLHIKLIMLHELGHMMGLVHEENTIMQAEGGLDDKHYAASLRQLFDLIEKEPK
jgi:Zn-dependent peptidase ImmA (M78 family)